MAIDLLDHTVNNNDLTNSGAAESADTPFASSSTSADLEASEGDYLSAIDSASLSFTGDFTLECWVKLESQPGFGLTYSLITKDAPGVSRSFDFFYDHQGDGIKYLDVYIFSNLTTWDRVNLAYTLPLDTWTHLALTCTIANATATEFEFFVNGVSQGNGAVVDNNNISSMADSTTDLQIGAWSSSSTFDGLMDEVRIWNDVRTVTEINNNKSVELTGNESNLVAYWPFETADADTTTSTSTSTTSTSTSTSTSSSTSTSTSTSSTTTISPTTSSSSTSTSTSTSSSTSTSTSTSSTTTQGPPEPINFMRGDIFPGYMAGSIYHKT